MTSHLQMASPFFGMTCPLLQNDLPILQLKTVNTVVPLTPFMLAVMVVVPVDTLVASPLTLIVATFASDDVHEPEW